jgi:hypothetical protein
MKTRSAIVIAGLVMALGVEGLNPAHRPYDLPHSHSEVPDGAPTMYVVRILTNATTNPDAHLTAFVSPDTSGK